MGHVHNYQRFTRDMSHFRGRDLNYVIAGAGGYAGFNHLHQLKAGVVPPPGVILAAHETTLPGFLRITVTDTQLVGEYLTVPRPPEHLSGDAIVVDHFQIML